MSEWNCIKMRKEREKGRRGEERERRGEEGERKKKREGWGRRREVRVETEGRSWNSVIISVPFCKVRGLL